MTKDVKVIDHPLVQHKLTLLRKKQTNTPNFRAIIHELSSLLAYEVTRDLPQHIVEVETPLGARTEGTLLDGRNVVLISILRAGEGLLEGMLQVLPFARVGHVGLYREPRTLVAVEYYFKVPPGMKDATTVVVDPMLATGHSAIAAVERVKEAKPAQIKLVCVLAAPEGIAAFHEHHPDVPIYTASVDERLDEKGYILPGIGDAGDRLYGTL